MIYNVIIIIKNGGLDMVITDQKNSKIKNKNNLIEAQNELDNKIIGVGILPIVIYSNMYLNSPCGDSVIYNNTLIEWVQKIGRTYGKKYRGSHLRKGIQYLKEQTGCTSTRQIKLMLKSVHVAVCHDSGEFTYIFRCSKKFYTEVLKYIISMPIFKNNSNESNSDYLIKDAKKGIISLTFYGTDNRVKKDADKMLRDIHMLD